MKQTKAFGLGHAFLTLNWAAFAERQLLSEGACPLSVRRCSWLSSFNQGKTFRCSDLEGKAGCGRQKASGLRGKGGGGNQRKEMDKINWPKKKKSALPWEGLLALFLLVRWPLSGEGLKLLISQKQAILVLLLRKMSHEGYTSKTLLWTFWIFCVVPGFVKAECRVE